MATYSDALERKLAPIYDAIDCRNYKGGLKHIDAALKKHSKNQLLTALRAFCLHRTGRADEALALLQSIVDQGPESERVLHTMTFTYRADNKPNLIAEAYAAAAHHHPDDVEILQGLFGAYAKELNFVKQQQVALKLSKLHPDQSDTYSWWSIVSVALQARQLFTSDHQKALQLMKLAETMIQRQITKQNGMKTYETLLLYVDILQGQGNAAAAVNVIREAEGKPAGGLVKDSKQLLAAALIRSNDLDGAAAIYREACLADPDDWWSWQLYLNCVLPKSYKPILSNSTTTANSIFPVGIIGGLTEQWDAQHFDSLFLRRPGNLHIDAEPDPSLNLENIANAKFTLEEMTKQAQQKVSSTLSLSAEEAGKKTTNGSQKHNRGVSLAPLELSLRLYRLHAIPTADYCNAILTALSALRHTFSSFIDLRPYINELSQSSSTMSESECIEFVQHVCDQTCTSKMKDNKESRKEDDDDNDGNAKSIQTIWGHVKAEALRHEIQRKLNMRFETSRPVSMSDTEAVRYAVRLTDVFAKHMHLSQHLDPKDRGHGEDLIAIIAGSLTYASKKSKRPFFLLYLAAMALEAAMVKRTVAAPLRLAACAVYTLMSIPTQAVAQLTALDVKSILHETLTGHWALPALLSGGAPEVQLTPWLTGISNVHVDQVLEASESMYTAYQQETYSKIPEFVDFWKTLRNSHTKWMGVVESEIVRLRNHDITAGIVYDAAQDGTKPSFELLLESISENSSLRFNEDLSTRPWWWQPIPVGPRFYTAAWWKEQREAYSSSLLWWDVNGSAESDSMSAQEWRLAHQGSVVRRSVLPILLSNLLQLNSNNPSASKFTSSKPLGAETLEELQRLVRVFQSQMHVKSSSDTNTGDAAADAIDSASSNVMLSLFNAGIAVHSAALRCTAEKNLKKEESEDAGDEGVQRLSKIACDAIVALQNELKTLIEHHILQETTPPVSASGVAHLVPVASPLLNEELYWTAACFVKWSKIAAKPCPDVHTALTLAANYLYSHVVSRIDAELESQCSQIGLHKTASQMLADILAVYPDASALWSYESTFNAEKVLAEILKAQGETVARLRKQASKILTMISAARLVVMT